MAIDYWSYW